MYPQNCSTHTPLQNHASIPFNHIEPKHNNKPEVKYIKQGVLLHKGKPTGKEQTKKLERTAKAKCHKDGYKQSQPVCHKPQGNRPDHRASRPSQSIDHKSDALGAHSPLQQKIKHSQLSTHKVPARLTC